MTNNRVKDAGDALAYITDCTLATVAKMATLKSRNKGELERQTRIAQKACDWIDQMGIDPSGTRAKDIIGKMTVKEWAQQYLPDDQSCL